MRNHYLYGFVNEILNSCVQLKLHKGIGTHKTLDDYLQFKWCLPSSPLLISPPNGFGLGLAIQFL